MIRIACPWTKATHTFKCMNMCTTFTTQSCTDIQLDVVIYIDSIKFKHVCSFHPSKLRTKLRTHMNMCLCEQYHDVRHLTPGQLTPRLLHHVIGTTVLFLWHAHFMTVTYPHYHSHTHPNLSYIHSVTCIVLFQSSHWHLGAGKGNPTRIIIIV
jgi:hypothetical protein